MWGGWYTVDYTALGVVWVAYTAREGEGGRLHNSGVAWVGYTAWGVAGVGNTALGWLW